MLKRSFKVKPTSRQWRLNIHEKFVEVLQSHAGIQPMITMAINVRTDIFTDKALQANTENIQHKSDITGWQNALFGIANLAFKRL